MKTNQIHGAILLSLSFTGSLCGVTIFAEPINGELSNSGLTPTLVTLQPGLNTILGTIGNNGQTGATDGTDGDFFTFTIISGFEVSSIETTRSTPGIQSFVGYNDSSTITETTTAGLAGGNLFDVDGGLNPTSITPIPTTLGAGDHSFVFQEIANQVVDYSVTFNLVAVPEPASVSLLAIALSSLITRRRR